MKRYFKSDDTYIQDIVLQPGTYTFWAYIKSEFGDKYTFALANEADEWEVFDVDVQQGLWTKAYIIFTITEKKVKLNLIKRYFDPSHPVYVLNPQIIKGNIPSDAGASPFDIDQITDDLHDEITSISDFTNDEFADKVLSSGERVSLKRDLETVEVIFQSLKGSFDKLIINPFISADVINDLITKYNEVASAKTVFFGVINGIIDGDGVISQDEIDSKNEKLDALNNAIYEYNMAEKEIANSMGEDYTQKIDEAIVKATYWSVKSSSPVIYKNASDASTSGSHVPITVSGELRSGTTTTQGGFITVTPNGETEAGTATASPVTIAPANGDGKTSYTVRLYDTASKTTLLDTMTIPVVFKGASGVNAISVVLSNEADVLPASPEGVVSDYSGSGTTIRVFEGATELDYDGIGTANGKFNVTAGEDEITVGTKSKSGLMCIFGDASDMTSDNASITFIITGKTQSGDSFSIIKRQSLSKSKAGTNGVSITLVDVEFAKNTNPTTPPTTGWSTTSPTLSEGEQLWTRTKTTYSSGSPTYTTPANITPKKGDVGTGVESVTEEYAISTSKTVQPTTGWSTTQPAWVQGQYIWSRVKVVYKNPPSTVYMGYAVSSEWEAINDIEIGGRNLLLNSKGKFVVSAEDTGQESDNWQHYRFYCNMALNEQYTISADIEIDEGSFTQVTVYPYPDGVSANVDIPSNGRIKHTFTKTNATTNSVLIYAGIAGATRGNGIFIREVKIEKGNKATEWTPAPEDVEADILKAEGYMKFRYLRDWIQGSSVDNNNRWKRIKIIDKNGFDLAFNKPVTSNGTFNTNYPASNIVDNNLTTYAQIDGTSPATLNYVQVDLLQVRNNVDHVQIHHYHDDGRTFNSTKTEISEDGVNWTTIFDSAKSWTYKETVYGNTISFRTQNLEATILRSGALSDRFSGFDGGLATAVIMEMREPSTTTRGDATAGLSGIKGTDGDLPAFWAGGTYQNALDGVAKTILNHDGSGHLAGGNISWDVNGNAEFAGAIDAESGYIGSLEIKSDGYIDLPPTFSDQKGRLDNSGLKLIYDGSSSQKIEWYTGLGTFAGSIQPNYDGHLRIESSFGVRIESGYDIYLGYEGLFNDIFIGNSSATIKFGGSKLDNIQKITNLGFPQMAYSTLAMVDNTIYTINTDTSLLVVTSAGSNSGIFKINAGGGGVSPTNGMVKIVLNVSTSIVRFKCTTAGSNIKYHQINQEFQLGGNALAILVYYGGYWRIHMDWGQ